MIDRLLAQLNQWASLQSQILAVALVGSHARHPTHPKGTARADSDIDIMLICTEPTKYLTDTSWLSEFGEVKSAEQEDWGLVQSLRVCFVDGQEVEFGFTTQEWVNTNPVDTGTIRVIRDGARVIHDPHGLLEKLIRVITEGA